jgi:hypothetical protein
MLSRDCDGCEQQRQCIQRYKLATTGEKVMCPDGTQHLIDGGSEMDE